MSTQTKERFETRKILALWSKMGMENVIFFSILAPMSKLRNIVYKEALKV
jgi:hypothetical protein